MGDHFFLLMYATSGEERNVTRFTSYRRVEDAVAMVKEWLGELLPGGGGGGPAGGQ